MPQAAIAALTVLIVILLYVFLWQIARSIRAHLGPADSTVPAVALTIRAPDAVAGRVIVVDRPIVAGRSPDADLPLDDAYCSELHARFSLEEGRLMVRDLGSTNGTFVNEQRIEAAVAPAQGDTVRLGQTIMEVR